MDRSTSRKYGVAFNHIQFSPAELDIIRSNANDILRSEHGFDTARAWTNAVLMALNHKGLLNLVSDTETNED